MATFVRVTSDGSLRTIVLPFTSQYSGQDVSVTAIAGSIPNWGLSGNTVVFVANVPAGTVVQVARKTPVNIRYKFSQGAAFTAGNLDFDLQQLLNISEEARDLASAGIVGNLNMQANRIINLGAPRDLSDAATKQYVDEAVNAARGQDYSNTLRTLETRVTVAEGRIQAHSSAVESLSTRVRTLEGIQSPLPNGFFQNGKVNPEFLPDNMSGGGQAPAQTWRYGFVPKTVAALSGAPVHYDLWMHDSGDPHDRKRFRALWFLDETYTQGSPSSTTTTYLMDYRVWEENPTIHQGKSRLTFYKELVDAKAELADATNQLRNRVRALENGGSSGGGGGGGTGLSVNNLGVADLGGATLRNIGAPTRTTDAVNLGTLQEIIATDHAVLEEKANTFVRALGVEFRDRVLQTEKAVDALSGVVEKLKSQGGGTPQPSPSPSPSPAPGGSTGGLSMGVIALPRSTPRVFTSGVANPGKGVSGGTTAYAFGLTPGMWEFRIHAKGGNVADVSFVGNGTITSSFAEYTIHTVQNCSQVTVTLPAPGTWSFSITGVYIGAQVG
jgi:hypothetical protein